MSIPLFQHKIKYELVRKRNFFQNNGVQRSVFSCFIPTLQSYPFFGVKHVQDSSGTWSGAKRHPQGIVKALSKNSMSLKTSTIARYLSSAEEENGVHRFQFCPDCHGMGKKPSRKHRSKKKRLKNNNVQLLEKCFNCDGTGLVLSTSPSAVLDCTHNKDHHVSIIGGDIGGMALALALQHRQIPCTIYEKDTHFDERLQGYGLTIQQGNTALTSLGIHQLDGGIYSKRHVVHATNGTILGQWGHRVWVGGESNNEQSKIGSKKQRQNVHIARQKLREILYQQLLVHSSSSDLIQWGHKFLKYSKNHTDGHMEMTFSVGEETKKEKTSIIVGADGIFSNVRKQKFTSPQTKMNYLGCIVILGICSTPSNYLDDETVFQTADGTTRLYAMPFSPNSINEFLPSPSNNSTTINKSVSNDTTTTMWQLSFPMDEKEAICLSQTRETLHNEALKRCQSWHEPIPTILKSTPTDLVSGYPVYDRNIPEGEYFRKGDDDSSSEVTFIGDAAHPMSPFKVRTILFRNSIFVNCSKSF